MQGRPERIRPAGRTFLTMFTTRDFEGIPHTGAGKARRGRMTMSGP